jgi:hypothetical protein
MSGKEKCNIMITFQALEVKLAEEKNKDTWLSCVIKRGDQQREETDRMQYLPLQEDQQDKNIQAYESIIKQNRMENSENYKSYLANQS